MASFQIHEDQENQVNNVRLRATKNVNVPQTRSALGTITQQSTNISQPQRVSLKPVAPTVQVKNTKSTFTVHEDKQSKEKNDEVKVVSVNKPTKAGKFANKENDIPINVPVLPRQPLKELPCLFDKEEKEDDVMSEGSAAYEDELNMAVDKSIEIKELQSESLILYDMDEYRDDIFKYLLKTEDRNRPKANYMRRQPDITYSMRTILIDWLVEVGEEYKLHSETLHIAVYLIDRFLSLMSVVRAKLQLLGTAAMFVASKYEEIYPPDVTEFTYITDDTYNKKQVLRMEHLILKVLMFDISLPTSLTFIQIICVSCTQKSRVLNLALYLCELTLLEGDPYLQFLPSKVACSAIALARHCLELDEPWPSDLEKFTGYSLNDLEQCVGHLNLTHFSAPSLTQQAIQDKYRSFKWQSVSDIEHRPLIIDAS